MKPYVNFLEYEQNTKVKESIKALDRALFPKTRVHKTIPNLTWEQWERIAIRLHGLKGRDKALFLGHSRNWAGTPLT
jgi:hypothetical protein